MERLVKRKDIGVWRLRIQPGHQDDGQVAKDSQDIGNKDHDKERKLQLGLVWEALEDELLGVHSSLSC